MLYNAVVKLFKALLRFVNTEHYRDIESVLNGLEMALNRIVTILYVIDILYYTTLYDSWGIGRGICTLVTCKLEIWLL